jgi:hypothetical protein
MPLKDSFTPKMATETYVEIVGKFALRGLEQKESSIQFVFSYTQHACKTIGPLYRYGLNFNVSLSNAAVLRWLLVGKKNNN